MKLLKNILAGVETVQPVKAGGLPIKNIAVDSRKVEDGSLFVAVRGIKTDGHKFIDKAVEAGAVAIICEKLPAGSFDEVNFVKVKDSRKALALAAANFYGHPSTKLNLVGITGTNGKTSTATLLYRLFSRLGFKTGLISTIENRVDRKVVPANLTTPDPIALQALLAEMVDTGCAYAFMEVSSHAIDQSRIDGMAFAGGVFTNITHDHLDYHKTFKAYINTKKRFFDDLGTESFALINKDDKRHEVMVQNTKSRTFYYSLKKTANFKGKIVENSIHGMHLVIDEKEVHVKMIGEFNAYNLLAVFGTAVLLEMDPIEVLKELSDLPAAEGRFDFFLDPGRSVLGIVDYAHTPDALEKVLDTIHKMNDNKGAVITVVGCGGERDKQKRPLMTKIACDYSDQVILTSDNPRSEDPYAILADMETGIPAYAAKKVLIIADRRQAIKTASRLAQRGDIILLAGKGHEKYQEINGKKIPFDDKKELMDAL